MILLYKLFDSVLVRDRKPIILGKSAVSLVVLSWCGTITIGVPDTQSPANGTANPGSSTQRVSADIDIQKRCIDCHSFNPIFSHPVGVVPPASMDVPAELPLVNGRMTCATCHTQASPDHENARRDPNTDLSPVRIGVGLCISCHDSMGSGFEELHALSIGQAHLTQSVQRDRVSHQPSIGASRIMDAESDMCLTCHDGAMASSSGAVSGMIRGDSMLDPGSSEHPLGLYRYSDRLDPDGELMPTAMLDHRVRLFENQVGCGSCHSVYSTESDLLVMSNQGSQLCLSCHQY